MDKTKKRPTLALCMIVKNEEKNLPRILKSVEGCFDEIHITDTGSSDKTLDFLKEYTFTTATGYKRTIDVHHFQWVDDFSAARNYSFSHAKHCGYRMWLDADDTLVNPEAFKVWRDNAMSLADMWLTNYNYAQNMRDEPLCTFTRERVIKSTVNGGWKYFVHEGYAPDTLKMNDFKVQAALTHSWSVKHHRKLEDMKKDIGRNLALFEKNKDNLDPRMTYYYGKELFEAGQTRHSLKYLSAAAAEKELEVHDKVLSMQYFAYAARTEANKLRPDNPQAIGERNKFLVDAINMCHQALILMPTRAEILCCMGDCYLDLNQPLAALPYFSAAKFCIGQPMADTKGVQSAIYTFADSYQKYPMQMLSKIYFNIGEFQKALDESTACHAKFKDNESKEIIAMCNKAMKVAFIPNLGEVEEVPDIVITCPPNAAYPWDEAIAKEKGMGGSETAAIEMAKHLKKLTGRPVKIFNVRDDDLIASSGVEYISNKRLNEYFSKYLPAAHIAWRHNLLVTNAPTYLWCHDLMIPGLEHGLQADQLLSLSPFHKNFAHAMAGVPLDKIRLTRNGIEPSRFLDTHTVTKNPNKFVFPSSPDRGLDRAIKVLDIVREKFPDIELHVFYGIENLYKYGLGDLAKRLEEMFQERPWIKYHGFTQQDEMIKHFKEGCIWLHPANFIETFCITAIEMLCSGVYPITRRLGALQDTLKEAEETGMATIIDSDCETEEDHKLWANAVVQALEEKAWEGVKVDPEKYSWESVAKEWLEWLPLKPMKKAHEESPVYYNGKADIHVNGMFSP